MAEILLGTGELLRTACHLGLVVAALVVVGVLVSLMCWIIRSGRTDDSDQRGR